jgi:hypothetical protein
MPGSRLILKWVGIIFVIILHRFMLHLFIFFNTNKSYRQSRYYSLHWAHTAWENISD